MIPLSLQLSNFLSYGENTAPLDFRPFQMACLSGRNGHGKSALLDAITWAVWGEARKASYHSRNPDPDLLRLNAEEMQVNFRFMLNEVEYEVERSYRRGRTSRIEFRARQNPDEGMHVFTGANKRETQQRIIETLGLDYKTFVNSSFLQQGKADAFTRQPPQERKQILGAILGLDDYDRLLEEAKQRWSACRAERKQVEETLNRISETLETEEAVRQEETQIKQERDAVQAELNQLLTRENELREQLMNLQQTRQRLEQIQREQQSLTEQIEQLHKRRERQTQERQRCEELIARASQIEAAYQRYEEIGQTLKELLVVDEEAQRLESDRQSAERAIEQEASQLREQRAALQAEAQKWQSTLAEAETLLKDRPQIESAYQQYQSLFEQEKALEALRPRYEELDAQRQAAQQAIDAARQALQEEIAGRRAQCQDLPALEKRIDETRKRFEKWPSLIEHETQLRARLENIEETGRQERAHFDQDAARLQQCTEEIAETQEKLALMQSGQDQGCPLCGQSLSQSGRDALTQKLNQQIAQRQSEQKALQQSQAERQKRLEQFRQDFRQAKDKLDEVAKERSNLESLQTVLTQQEEEWQQKQKAQSALQTAQTQLQEQRFAEPERKRLQEINQQIEALGYQPEAHQQLRQQIYQSRQAETQWQQLQDARKRQEEAQQALQTTRQRLEPIAAQLHDQDFAHDARKQREQLDQQLAQVRRRLETRQPLQQEQYQLRNAHSERDRLHEAKRLKPQLDEELRQLQQQIEQCQTQRHQLAQESSQKQPALAQSEQLEKDLQTVANQRQSLSQRNEDIIGRLGAVQERLAALAAQQKEIEQQRQRLSDLDRDLTVYDCLKTAFSRDGIPAMIVEQALPELENDANRLLHRLTQGSCSIALESQRERKSGGLVETLDIKISDELGTRDYELFSGGEAFRADLALRIALSQLLCRRAGRQLQMLVIDEGFGTQDSEGLARIVDAIHDIHDEFEKILVVTHLEELKERFMTRIEVYKEPGLGSTFQVIHTA